MKSLRISLAAAVAVALVLLAGCGSLGDVLGTGNTGNNYPTTTQSTDIQGTVTNVDTNARRIDLNVNSNNGNPGNQYTSSVYYDNRTQFSFQNRSVNPVDIRRGDQIDVRAYNNGNNRYVADTVYILGSATTSTYPGTYPSGTYPSGQTIAIQGTVNYVDASAQRIDVTSAYVTGLRTNGSQGTYSVYYGSQTPVYYQGQTYSPSSLERGDQIDVRAVDNGNGRYMADSITVTRNIRGQ